MGDPLALALVALAAFVAGTVNAVAGGGTLITFPALTGAGLAATVANVTSTVALAPGYASGAAAQRADLVGQRRRAAVLVPVGVAGGLAGGALLLATGERLFQAIVPFLLFTASAILWLQPRVRRIVRERTDRAGDAPAERLAPWLVVAVFLASVYGGYFGAGLGIVLLAVLGLGLEDDLRRINALRLAVAFGVNGTAALFFLASGYVAWDAAIVMMVGAIAGGAFGGRIADRVDEDVLRLTVVAIGIAVGIAFLLRVL